MRAYCFLISFFLLTACSAPTVPSGSPRSLPAVSGSSISSASHSASSIHDAPLAPLPRLSSRPVLKPFGLYVSPGHSPVSPERFTGYHTGEDFETFPDEQATDVPVTALCEGTVKLARSVSGYGGVLVQSCTLGGQVVTVLYGHLRASSIKPRIGNTIQPGDFIALLGTGYTQETDGERKHLHLGIHKGTAVDVRGYVQKKEQLSGWVDPSLFLR